MNYKVVHAIILNLARCTLNMKTLAIKLVFLALAIVSLSNCKKVGKTYDAYFYTGNEISDGYLILELDNKIVGQVPSLKTTLTVNNDTIRNKALHLKLKSGKYKISVQDNFGNVKCSGVFNCRFNNYNGATNPGVLEYAMTNDVIVTRIHF